MMRNLRRNFVFTLCAVVITMMGLLTSPTFAMSIDASLSKALTKTEQTFLEQHKDDTFYIGLDPIAGMEYFSDSEGEKGYLKNVAALLSEKLGITFQIMPELSWGEAVEGLESGKIQVLFGANPTEERLKIMDFTEPIYSVPYTMLSPVEGKVQNIGDINGKHIGFLEGDAVVELFKAAYPNLTYDPIFFDNQEDALKLLKQNRLDAFITSGGDVVYDYLFRYPEIQVVANLEEIRSLMTFSALKVNAPLVSTLTKTFSLCEKDITGMIDDARKQYVRKILNLSPLEIKWLREHPSIKVGVPNDYLPIDYYSDGAYNGIAGHYLTSFADLIGIEIIAVSGSFDEVYALIQNGEIDILNMAKTEDRLGNFVFTNAFSNERDQIYGSRDAVYVHDIYGLEGKRVAVIEGFWHIDHLNMNLRNPQLVIVSDIQEAIEAVDSNRADYFIETPSVAEFYISGLGFTDIIKKGETSSDSFLYFGMLKQHAPLASLFNRTKLLLNYDSSKYLGVLNVPKIDNIANKRLGMILFGVSLIIIVLMLLLLRLQRDLFLTKEREKLIYVDPLTGLYNRNYFNLIEKDIDQRAFPQNIFMLDINNLKTVNDEYGHAYGDRLIDAISKIITDTADSYKGTAIRMGGDEFILCFFGIHAEKNDEIASRLAFCFNSTTLKDGDKTILDALQVAIGFSSREDATKTFEQCFKDADESMYRRKAEMKAAKQ